MERPLTPETESARQAALERYAILDTEREDAYDRIIRIICHLYAAPIATVTFVDRDRQWFKSSRGIDDCQTSREISFCGHVVYQAEPLIVDDTHQDERFHDNPLVTGPPHVRAYAGVPIVSPDGFVIGVLCVQDQRPRSFSELDLTPLQDLAQMVTDELELRLASRELEQERNLFLGGPTVAFVWEPEPGRWPVRYISPNVTEVLGYRPEELVGTAYGALIDAEDRERIAAEERAAAHRCAARSTQPIEPSPYRLQAADGSWRWIYESSVIEFDEQGRWIAIRGYINDITERVEREQALAEANERLAETERIAQIGHWRTYPDSGALQWSPMTYELLGFDPRGPEPKLADLLERIPYEDHHQVAEFQFQADSDRTACEGTYRIQRPDGRVLWVREVAQQWHDEQGRWVVQGTVQDVTEYQETLLALHERQRQHEAIFRRAKSISLIQLDVCGVIQEASHGAEVLFGYTRAELIGQNAGMLASPDEQHLPAQVIERVRLGCQEVTEEIRPIHRSGRVFPALLSLVPVFDEDHELVGAVAACMDLSKQATERERYRMAQEAARFGVWEWDLERDAIYWDEACWRMLGYDPAEGRTLGFADWQVRVHPDDLPKAERIVWAKINRGQPFTTVFRYRRADGGWLWVQGRGQIVEHAADGRPRRMVGTHVEIDRLKRTEGELRQREHWLGALQSITANPHRTLDDKLVEVLRLSAEVLGLPYARLSRIGEGSCTIRAAYPERDAAPTGTVHELCAACCVHRIAEEPQLAGPWLQWEEHKRPESVRGDGPVGFAGGDGARRLSPLCGERNGSVGAYFAVPLWAGDVRYGVLLLYGPEPRARLTRFQRQFLRLLGQWVSYELTQEAHNEALVDQAERDALTGAYRRPPFEAGLDKALAHHRRYGTPAGVILLDIDHFKPLNDTYGHAAGDQVLRELVERLRQALREPDLLARWGGEEFAILAPETDAVGLRSLAERLRESVVASPLIEGVGLVSISVGATALEPGDEANTVLGRADRALYRAKHAGRNRIAIDQAGLANEAGTS
ncbi:PAS domain-containing protein [Halorhodospira abdelmalekii]|uniref:PAS domain-containing protein n=1 Tax=Halorhodospira abdelmalekii TaxID=421629 RepID=UPI0019081206|nr:PAS domain-containing protein [Halorhodospira abdelmalekii]